MTTPTYVVSQDAYYKIYFHAAKHPHKPVNGILLGSADAAHSTVTIADAVPLVHHWTSLSPMMEIGLDLATQHADSIGLEVVGYYQASERLDDTALAPVGERVASTVKASFPQAIAFVIDNNKLGSTESALLPYLPQQGSPAWRPPTTSTPAPFTDGSKFQLASSDIPAEASRLVREQNQHFAFGDFDDHLEDVTIDWLRNRACLP